MRRRVCSAAVPVRSIMDGISMSPEREKDVEVPPVATESMPVWRAPWEFAVHAFVGTSIFGIIAVPAIALEILLKELQKLYHDIDLIVIFGLKTGSYLLFITDIGLFTVFLWRAAKRALQNL